MALRLATQNDALAVAEVQVAGWRSAYRGLMPDAVLENLSVPRRESVWRAIIAEGRFELILAEVNAAIVGFVNFGPSRDPDAATATVGEILAIYVHPGHWHRGTGQALMSAALSRLKSAGFKDVTLWVLDSMSRTRGFYERQGFAVDGAAKQEAIGGGAATINEVRYRRALSKDLLQENSSDPFSQWKK